MIEFDDLPVLHKPIMIAAFEGWNDAAESATGVLSHLAHVWTSDLLLEFDSEEYYDFQVNRPQLVFTDSGERALIWPSTRVFIVRDIHPAHDFVLVQGIEPNIKWPQFTREVLGLAAELDVDLLITVGSLLSDNPHTRPVPVTATATDQFLLRDLDVEHSRYEGPTGIIGVIHHACTQFGIPSISLWAAVPHYVGQSPCPKATLALIQKLEDVLRTSIPLGDLVEESRAWEQGVHELAEEDEDIAEYVSQLEEARDATELPEATGEAIAKEFERYLRRRDS